MSTSTETPTRATLSIRLTAEHREQLRAITRKIAPLARKDAIAPAVEMLARKVTSSWPLPRDVTASYERPVQAPPRPIDITPEALGNLRTVAEARDVDDGLLLRAALRAYAARSM